MLKYLCCDCCVENGCDLLDSHVVPCLDCPEQRTINDLAAEIGQIK